MPSGTKQLALIMQDPDTPIGTFVHWVVAGIAPSPPSIASGTDPVGAVQGANGAGRPGWIPPCPPSGPVHHYIFTLYALKKKVTLPPGGDAATLRELMNGKIIAAGEARRPLWHLTARSCHTAAIRSPRFPGHFLPLTRVEEEGCGYRKRCAEHHVRAQRR